VNRVHTFTSTLLYMQQEKWFYGYTVLRVSSNLGSNPEFNWEPERQLMLKVVPGTDFPTQLMWRAVPGTDFPTQLMLKSVPGTAISRAVRLNSGSDPRCGVWVI
jgi:hypothetical protein